MIELRNRALEQLRSGQLAIGVGLRQARTVDTAKAMRTAGFDWLFPAIAERIASNCRYPPIGHRSITGALPQLGFETHPLKDATEAINRETLVVVMLESPEAIDTVQAIAAIPGIDALLIGTNDLSLEMGIPGELGHPDVVAAYDSVIAACKTHGKYAGMGGVYKPELMAKYIEMGTQLILAGNDISFLMESARRQASA